nr:uncharacterized protein LOC128685085 [Cherax quadricarinatus]
MGTVAELRQGRPHRPVIPHERLPLHDRPSDSYQLFGPIFPPSRSSGSKRPSIRPSYPVRQAPAAAASDDAWHPSRTAARLSAHGRRGDEGIDVITAPPFQTFEVVLGSSINHDDKKRERSSIQVPPVPHNGPPIPFSKLTLGLEMPPPDALDALPPGSVLIPPSHIIGRPKLPIIHNKRNGTPGIEMPLAEFLPNLPFFSNKSPRFRPPAKPQAQDIPPRLPSFLSSLLPNAPSPRPVRPPGPVMSPPRSSGSLGGSSAFLDVNRPTGPPPPVSKLMPPGQWVSPSVPTVPVPQWPFEQDSASTSIARPGIVLSDVPTTVFGSFPHPSHHATDNVPPLHVSVSPSLKGATILKKQENPASYQPPLVDVQSEKEAESSGGAGNQPVDYTPNRSEGHNSESSGFIPGITHDQQRPSDSAYDPDLSPEYVNYYDVDYRDYYHIQTEGSSGSGQIDSGAKKQTHHHNSAASMDVVDLPIIITPTTTSPRLNSHLQEGHKGGDPMLDHLPSIVDLDGRHTSLDDLLGVRKPEVPPLTLTEQEKNDLQMLLQNHRMAYALAEGNGTVAKLSSIQGDSSVVDDLPAASVDEASSAPASFQGELATSDNGHYQVPLTGYRRGSQASLLPVEHDAHTVFGEHGVDAVLGGQDVDTVFGEHDPSVAHLWKNIQLIPLAPDLFEHATQDYDDTMNLTSLFDGAVPLSPGSNQDLEPDGHDLDGVASDTSGGHVTMSEEVMEDTDKANAKFMAYVLIGACCGLALLSIAGVIVIVRFKKTCGSRQIKTRSRLTEQDSIESISRRVENLTLGGESGHKLGSWFTGRNEQFGAGKLRSNMALPEVQDLKREKSSKSGSTRDLLSISSESSRSNSPGEVQRGEESGRTDDEEPRSSWLHDEYRASGSEASQEEQDQAYSPQQYQQSRSSPDTVTPKSHPADHHSVRPESSVEVDHMERSVRERRYTGQPRSDDDQLQRSASRRGPRYISSMDSDELEERLVTRDPHYTTDSELDDGTTHYDDDDESREPSRYFSDSRELDDVVASRRMDLAIMTSQELGEHLSRDLKQYQSRRTSKVQQQQEDNRDTSRLHESSQEVEGEDGSRELQRSQSQVSFSRDNVQNEVFLEFDNIFRQHGQYLNSEPAASTLGRVSRGTDDTHVSVSRANTPDSIDLPTEFLQDLRDHDDRERLPSSAPTTPPRFSPPTAPPRPPKPGHLSQPGTPSPQAGRARSPSPGQTSPSARNKQRPVYWTNEEERLI